MRNDKKRSIAVSGTWQPVPLDFLRSLACAQLSPHASKLLLDMLSFMGPNATRNGDISLAPKVLAPRGWTSRASIAAAVSELQDAQLIRQTRQGGRKDCSLWAVTLYPLDCDRRKVDPGADSFTSRDWMQASIKAAQMPTEHAPATWKRARKNSLACPATEQSREVRSATEQSPTRKRAA